MLSATARCEPSAMKFKQARKAFDSEFFNHSASSTKFTGLFGYKVLKSSSGFSQATDLALRKSREIVENVSNAHTSLDLLKTVKRLDQLSDLLCSVIDAAQCIKYVHPDKEFVKAADVAFSKLTHFLNQLNTNSQLYQKLKRVVQDPHLNQHLSNQERQVGQLLVNDFEKSGVHMPSNKKREFVQLHDQILELGHQFMNQAHPVSKPLNIPKEELKGLISFDWAKESKIRASGRQFTLIPYPFAKI